MSDARVADALRRPLGAYYRVNHKDLVAMHSAISEVGILYAAASVHAGWENVGSDGVIPLSDKLLGGHAFAIVAYDERGFWIQNSWGADWGAGGFALITYDDWLINGAYVWVARLGVPVRLSAPRSTAISHSATAAQSSTHIFSDLRPHIISIGNDGVLSDEGTFGTSKDDVQAIFEAAFSNITSEWPKKRLLLYAHGGLVEKTAAVQRLADYRQTLLDNHIYPISFVWHSDYWTTLTNILQESVRRRRPEGFLDAAKDFMLDRLDDALEPLARRFTGKAQWEEMKENARLATEGPDGGARFALAQLAKLLQKDPAIEVHIVGHSAGSIFHAPVIQLLTTKGAISSGPLRGEKGHGLPVASCTLWAPACTVALFKEAYLPAIQSGAIGRFSLFTLTDKAEQDDHCANIYHKSLLYLVSNAFEAKPRIPLLQDGEPILGMEKFVRDDPEIMGLVESRKIDWVLAPNSEADPSRRSTARHHGDFDDDTPTLQATLARLAGGPVTAEFEIHRSASSRRGRRRQIGRVAGL